MGLRWWAAVLAIGALAVPGAAAACSCGEPESWDYVLPARGASGVPLNTRVFVPPSMLPWEAGATPAFFLRDASGAAVAFDVVSFADFQVLFPREPLAPETAYRAGVVGEEFEAISFTTGREVDTVPPAVPEVVDVGEGEVSTGGSCSDEAYVPVEVRSEGDLVLMDLGAPSALDPATLAGAVDEVQPGGESLWFLIGEAGCSVPNASPGETVRVRFAALDGAGNLSAWTDPRRIEVPDYGCGCRSAGGADLGLLALGVVALALRRPGWRYSSAAAASAGGANSASPSSRASPSSSSST